MPIDFPTSPALDDPYSFGGVTWRWNGTGWRIVSGGSVGLPSSSVQVTTSTLAAGASEDLALPAGTRFLLLAITASTPAWVRVYGTTAARAADASRPNPGGTLPAAGTEFYAEVDTTAAPQTIRFAPTAPTVQGTAGNAFLRVRNEDSVSRAITLTFIIAKLED